MEVRQLGAHHCGQGPMTGGGPHSLECIPMAVGATTETNHATMTMTDKSNSNVHHTTTKKIQQE